MNILLSVDDSIYSEFAADVVLARIWPEKSCFRVISVSEEDETGFDEGIADPKSPSFNESPEPGSFQSLKKMTEKVAARLKEKMPTADIRSSVIAGNIKEKILDYADFWPSDLLVLGTQGRTGLSRFLLGSVSQTALLYSESNTLIVRRPKSEHELARLRHAPQKVLLPLADAGHSRQAAGWIMSMPWSQDTVFKLITVISPLSEPFSDGLDLLQGERLSAERRRELDLAQAMQKEVLGVMAEKFGVERVSAEIQEGDPGDAILRTASAWPADLIVMGTRGHGPLHRLWLGSVSQEVVLQAHCPVEVVKRLPSSG